jgi:hypothetical protein
MMPTIKIRRTLSPTPKIIIRVIPSKELSQPTFVRLIDNPYLALAMSRRAFTRETNVLNQGSNVSPIFLKFLLHRRDVYFSQNHETIQLDLRLNEKFCLLLSECDIGVR